MNISLDLNNSLTLVYMHTIDNMEENDQKISLKYKETTNNINF